jgi:hypothetical protein
MAISAGMNFRGRQSNNEKRPDSRIVCRTDRYRREYHGEIDALWNLLKQLGYEPGGVRPDCRQLVFIGCLTDRGPDSPAVLDVISGLMSRVLAQ